MGEPRQIFATYLEARRMRKTPERFAIMEAALEMTGHFAASTLYAALEAGSYHVSRTTLYTTLELLRGCGLLIAHRFDSAEITYERAGRSHLHLVCERCGLVEELNAGLPSLNVDFGGFAPRRMAVEVYGLCSKCEAADKRN